MKLDPQRALPSRHLVAFFTFASLLPLVHYIPPWIARNVSSDQWVVTILAVGIIVPIISYLVLPAMFWLLRITRG